MHQPRLNFWQIWNMSFGFLGIQFGWGLQMANMSSIYRYLGADEDKLSLLWLAAPVTGVIIQPLIGQMSDRTWTPLGRRRPFILAGALLASLALVLMPNSGTVWMAAGLLWVLDGTINASMQPFRALVADNLPEEQKSQGFAIQSLFIGLGGTVASALPWMLTNWGGVTGGSTAGSAIPASVRISFYIGAVAFLGAVLWSVLKTVEYPPAADELVALRARKFDWSLGLGEVLALVGHLPRRMWELGLVQFFTWIGMFCMWVYFSPAIAAGVFHAAKGSPEMTAAGDWTGICFGMYNAVCFLFSFVLLWATRFTGPKVMHALCLAVGAAGLAAVHLASGKNELLLSMIAVGVAWASILSMPYAMLAPALPRQQVGVMMGMFNLFIVFPQIAFSALGDSLFKSVLHSDPMNALLLGGGCLGVSALLTLVVVSFRSSETGAELPSGGTGH